MLGGTSCAALRECQTARFNLLDSSSRDSVRELIEARRTGGRDYPARGTGWIHFRGGEFGGAGDRDRGGKLSHLRGRVRDLDMADEIVINAKTQRPSVCNAAEKLLVHERIAADYIPRIAAKLREARRGVAWG